MKTLKITGLGLIPLALAACATSTGPSRYQQELDAYAAECRERGGILQPIPGVATGEARADHACVIRGAASRLD